MRTRKYTEKNGLTRKFPFAGLHNSLQILLFFSFLFSLFSLSAQTIGEAFYIYRNDGGFNAFLRSEVDSMAYSFYDADSILYTDIVSQIIYTQDSTYVIPLAAIDSLSFVTPKTKYQPGVKVVDSPMRDYIISRDDLTLLFRADTPNGILPRHGDILVSTTGDKILESAFIGKVDDVEVGDEGILVVCKMAALTDAFETYYGFVREERPISVKGEYRQAKGNTNDGVHEGQYVFAPGRLSWDVFNTYNTSFSYNKDDQISYGIDNARFTLSLTPVITFRAFTIINRSEVYTSLSIIGDYTVEEELALSGNFTFNTDFPVFKPKPIPVPEALLDITFEAGIYGNAQANISLDQHWTQKLKSSFLWNWSSRGNAPLRNSHDLHMVSNTHNGKVAVNGAVGVGIYFKPGVAFIATSDLDIAEAGIRAEFGISLEGTYVPYKRDEEAARTSIDLYNQIKDRNVGVYGYRSIKAEAKLFKWSASHSLDGLLPFPLDKKEPLASIRSVPLFSDTKLEHNDDGSYFASTKVIGGTEPNITQPCEVGLALINEDDKSDATYSYTLSDFTDGTKDLYATIFGKDKQAKYVAYPLVKYMGMDMIAEPRAEVKDSICPDANHPHWIDMGLPSGTQWRCCNEGASTPEAYGGYYTFGQVSSTPTLEQIEELLNYCTSDLTSVNGVYGCKFTGPNGGTIFLPAAGSVIEGELYGLGTTGLYWSSTPYDLLFAYALGFNSGLAGWYSGNYRLDGDSVRPVR